MTEWIKNTGVKPILGKSAYAVRFRNDEVRSNLDLAKGEDFNWSLYGSRGDIIEWRFTKKTKAINNNPNEVARSASLSQGQVQQLLHELRDTLSMVTEIKNDFKRCATSLWELSDKDDAWSFLYFEGFSLNRKMYLQYKKREQRLVGLITKLKGLK